ncbi:MAG: hypothetical protein GEV10_14750 [Streptosporangiales bacterium]|nr:hypothetical protein [Streptosporangiales bacterium]
MSGAMLTMLLLVAVMVLGVASSLISVHWSHRYQPRDVTRMRPERRQGQLCGSDTRPSGARH